MWVKREPRVGEGTRLQRGAAASAPTAPHATPALEGQAASSGPARFWSQRRARRALRAAVIVSLLAHYVAGPWSLMPQGPAIDVKDSDGELTIPIDSLPAQASEPPPPHATAPTTTAPGPAGSAAPAKTSEIPDAAMDHRAPPDAARASNSDGGFEAGSDTESDAAFADDAQTLKTEGGTIVAQADAGAGGSGSASDPTSLVGAAAGVSAGPNNVTLLVNMAVIRSHQLGAKLGPILAVIPQWREFMAGAPLDPLRDTDWILIMGPSLVRTERDAVYVHYNADDRVVDAALDAVSKSYAKGGSFNVGVKGVKAWRAFADGAERAFLRPRSHVAVIVPASHAVQFAKAISKSPLTPRLRVGEAMSIRALRPGGSISVIPQSISELRVWVVPRLDDGGADVYGEGDCADAASAAEAAEILNRELSRRNSIAVRILSAGLLNTVEITSDATRVKLHAPASKEQIEAVWGLVAQQLGAASPP